MPDALWIEAQELLPGLSSGLETGAISEGVQQSYSINQRLNQHSVDNFIRVTVPKFRTVEKVGACYVVVSLGTEIAASGVAAWVVLAIRAQWFEFAQVWMTPVALAFVFGWIQIMLLQIVALVLRRSDRRLSQNVPLDQLDVVKRSLDELIQAYLPLLKPIENSQVSLLFLLYSGIVGTVLILLSSLVIIPEQIVAWITPRLTLPQSSSEFLSLMLVPMVAMAWSQQYGSALTELYRSYDAKQTFCRHCGSRATLRDSVRFQNWLIEQCDLPQSEQAAIAADNIRYRAWCCTRCAPEDLSQHYFQCLQRGGKIVCPHCQAKTLQSQQQKLGQNRIQTDERCDHCGYHVQRYDDGTRQTMKYLRKPWRSKA